MMEKPELNDFERYALWWLGNDRMVTMDAGSRYISEFDLLVKHGYARGEVFESRARVYTITKAGDARATSEFGGLS